MDRELNRRSVLKSMGVVAAGAAAMRLGFEKVSAAGALTEISSGVSETPTAAVVWRVVRDVAPPAGTGELRERALGFVLANRGDLVITTLAGAPALVLESESSFVPEADLQAQEGANGESVPYIRFGLVNPAEATYTAGGELLFGSEMQQFAAGGEVLARLYEGRLSGAEAIALPSTGVNGTVVYSDRGSIAVVGIAGDGSQTHRFDLNPGQAVVPAVAGNPPDHWEVIVAGEVEHVTFYVATAEQTGGGNDASSDPPIVHSGSDPAAFGTLAVQLYGCPDELGHADLGSCGSWPGKFALELESFETGIVHEKANAVLESDGSYQFALPYGSYLVWWDTFQGSSSSLVRVDGEPVQNPVAAVSPEHQFTVVQIFAVS